MIEFIELKKFPPRNPGDSKYGLVELWINEAHVFRLSSAHKYNTFLQEGRLPNGLDAALEFTEVYLNVVTSEHVASVDSTAPPEVECHIVVGAPSTIADKLNLGTKKKKTLLKG